MKRALRATTASSPRAIKMKAAPTSGKNVTRDRSGQWLTTNALRSMREQIPRHERGQSDHHRKSIMVHIASLQPAGLPRQIAGHRSEAIRAKPVDQRAVTRFPQPVAEHHRRADKQQIIEFVEIPFVEDE